MGQALGEVLALGVVLGVGVGPIGALIALLNRRDRRAAALHVTACAQFSGVVLRSDVAIAVRCAVLSRWARVSVDMRACPRDQLWDAMARLRQALPPSTELRVEGTLGRAIPARWTVEAWHSARAQARRLAGVAGA
jgi:hypothetical protein